MKHSLTSNMPTSTTEYSQRWHTLYSWTCPHPECIPHRRMIQSYDMERLEHMVEQHERVMHHIRP